MNTIQRLLLPLTVAFCAEAVIQIVIQGSENNARIPRVAGNPGPRVPHTRRRDILPCALAIALDRPDEPLSLRSPAALVAPGSDEERAVERQCSPQRVNRPAYVPPRIAGVLAHPDTRGVNARVHAACESGACAGGVRGARRGGDHA